MKYTDELRDYEGGMTEAQIAAKYGVKRGTIQFRLKAFRKQGILEGNHKANNVIVHWDQINSNTESNTPVIQKEEKRNTSAIQRISLSEEDAEILRQLIEREKAAQAGGVQSSGTKKAVTFRLDTALLDALKRRADAEGQTTTELLTRAIEGYLGG